MLVLLVIFMITAPMMTEGLDVELPKVEASETLPTENDHAILTVRDSGALFLDEYETSVDDLLSVLRTTVRDPGRQLFVRADKNVPYGVVMEVMGRIRHAGITDVGLITVPAHPSSGREESASVTPREEHSGADTSGTENQQ
jgi:biopolymer transport protein TolR